MTLFAAGVASWTQAGAQTSLCPEPKPPPPPSEECFAGWTCNRWDHAWEETYAPAYSSCDDGNDCTQFDYCADNRGQCVSGDPPPGIPYCPSSKPRPPSGFASTAADPPNSFRLTWNPVLDDSPPGYPLKYKVEENRGDGVYRLVAETTSPFVDLTRADGTYGYKLHACNLAGCGSKTPSYWDLTVKVLNRPGVPGAITGPTTSTTGVYTLSWAAATGAQILYELSQNGVVFPRKSSTTANIGTNPDTPRADGTYYYTVRACNPTGCSATTSAFTVTVLRPPSVPGAITGPTSPNTTGAFTLQWGAASGNVSRYELSENDQAPTSTTVTAVAISSRLDGDYRYKVRACNALSCGSDTPEFLVTVLHPAGAPGPIVGPATSSTGSYTLSWGAASGTVTGYVLRENGTTVYEGTALTADITGKADGVHRYQVCASNSVACTLGAEFSVSVQRPPGVPGAITGPPSSLGSHVLAWGAATGVVTRYELQENGVVVYVGATRRADIVGNVDGTYRYFVRACNDLGCGPSTAPDFVVTVQNPPGAPGAPGPISGPASSSTGSYTLTWGYSWGATNYLLVENDRLIPPWWLSATSLTLTGRVDGTYRYSVMACNTIPMEPFEEVCGPSTAEITVTVLLLPDAPWPIASSVTASTSGTYTISWKRPTGYTVDGYRLEWKQGDGAWIAMDLGAVESYTDTRLQDGVYSYRVSARNASGVGPATAPVSVTVAIASLSDALPDAPVEPPLVPPQQVKSLFVCKSHAE